MATENEKKALLTISERFLFGDLQKLLINEIKQQVVPWGALPEAEQQKVINRVKESTENAVREVVNIIAGKTRPTVIASVESVTFKDGIKVQLTFPRSMQDRHAIADAQGADVLLVLPDYESVLGGEGPKADKDQKELV